MSSIKIEITDGTNTVITHISKDHLLSLYENQGQKGANSIIEPSLKEFINKIKSIRSKQMLMG